MCAVVESALGSPDAVESALGSSDPTLGSSPHPAACCPACRPVQALGLLTNLTLRHPENAEAAVAGGTADAVLESLRGLLEAGDPPRTHAAARQACMALRNIGSRCASE